MTKVIMYLSCIYFFYFDSYSASFRFPMSFQIVNMLFLCCLNSGNLLLSNCFSSYNILPRSISILQVKMKYLYLINEAQLEDMKDRAMSMLKIKIQLLLNLFSALGPRLRNKEAFMINKVKKTLHLSCCLKFAIWF